MQLLKCQMCFLTVCIRPDFRTNVNLLTAGRNDDPSPEQQSAETAQLCHLQQSRHKCVETKER